MNTPRISLRQWQIIDLIRQAKRNQEIADTLGLSLATVREYVHRISRVLHLPNRTAIAVWALQHPKETA
jgi:DNA-binding NarL/FixJ family response regulator